MFASHMASRERTSETLDFHRSSPQPVEAKVIGLIVGSTWFEWGIFFILFFLELPFVLLPKVPLDTLDFTSFKMELGSKMIIDATKKQDKMGDGRRKMGKSKPSFSRSIISNLKSFDRRIIDAYLVADGLPGYG